MPLYLVPSAPEFDYERHDLAPSVHYVGLCVPPETDAHPAPGWIARKPGDPARIVVLEEPHYAEDPWLLRTAAAAFKGDSVEAILVAGQGRDPARLGLSELSPNVHLQPWTPLEYAIRSADVVVAHGNSETVLATLGKGTPVVILPRILEQPQIAWRVAASGSGVRLPLKRATPERLREAVQRVLGNASFAKQAQRISAALARCGGPARAGELVEGLVSPGLRKSTQFTN